ncbi:hypothetical protein HNQ91_003201 [Filimonas zeae]|uniref:Uncharacterized protein n=1 Tax=Filimonas zeae TaxID=1737353 RepID=A0A917MYM7_9BACT|nr:hypothetical protein [Filimonas zeae]MDR6340136.1 hypothetical protein [Filimonas zeae]GGH71315.1 hypothetical protein GCM10011379_30530 [Filimonas zeae]
METVNITIDIPDSFIKDCELYNISEHVMLQLFVTQLSTVCTILNGNEKILIGQTTKVFKDFLETTITIPSTHKKKNKVMARLMQNIIAMAVTETIEWSDEKYIQLINDGCKKLMIINKSR